MPLLLLPELRLNHTEDGTRSGPPVVFVNGLGTDLTLWDAVIPLLPQSLRLIRHDGRGHGLSDCPPGPYAMGTLIRDTERLMEALGVRDAVIVGLSLGGMIAQGLAVKRLDQIRAMVLISTAARIATPAIWQARIEAVRSGGMAAVADAGLSRWFAPAFRTSPQALALRDRLLAQNPEGYMAAAAAIAGTDFYTTTASLTLPTLALAGPHDGSTPPDLVRETAGLIPGSRFELIRGAGHLSPIDQPERLAEALSRFLRDIGHV